MKSTNVPPVPLACPPERRAEVESARSAAVVDLRIAEESEEEARSRRRDANATVLHYENLLREVDGQGRLEI